MATGTQHKCNMCGATFSTKEALMEHAKTHTMAGAQHKCNACGATFKSQSELMEHAKTHQKKP